MTRPPLTADDDPAWIHYGETIVEIEADDGALRIDLRQPLSEGDRRALALLGPKSSFGIVTPANPAGAPVDPAANARRHETLQAWLAEHGHPHRTATGSSPDGRHTEHGFAVWLEQGDVVAIATRFEQSAIFWFDGGAFWLVGALIGAKPRKLP